MSLDKDLKKLTEPFQTNVIKWLNECNTNGLEIFVTEARRTQKRQYELYGKGRGEQELLWADVPIQYARPLERQVTWTVNSLHISGQAVDIGFRGKKLYPNSFQKWRDVANIAKRYHIHWGFDLWGRDKPHFQWSGAVTPDKDTKEFFSYKSMDEKQKQLVQNMIYMFKSCHNFGTYEMKQIAKEQVKEWKSLIADESI